MSQYGGYEVTFTLSNSPGLTHYIELLSDHTCKLNETGTDFRITQTNDGLLYSYGSSATTLETYLGESYTLRDVRIVAHGPFVTVIVNGMWIHTFYSSYINYVEVGRLRLNADYAASFTNIVVTELYDWREAIWSEIEGVAQSVIQTIIQERPIDILGKANGALAFFYTPDLRPEVTVDADTISEHTVTYGDSGGSSDGLTYFADVITVIDSQYVQDFGFSTRIYRLSNLDYGAEHATKQLQLRARQSAEQHQLSARLDPRIEVGDLVDIGYTTADNWILAEKMIVESVSFNIARAFQMTLSGRSGFTTLSLYPRTA